MKNYKGSCHCGAVAFKADMELTGGMVCNCSHCHKKGVVLAFVPKSQFTLEKGADNLTEYRFNKKVISHQFCKTCGVQGFGSAGEQVAINLRCVDEVDLDTLPTQKYNGKDL